MRLHLATLPALLLVVSSPLLAQTKAPAAGGQSAAPAAAAQAAPAQPAPLDPAAVKEETKKLAAFSAADRTKIVAAGKALQKRLGEPAPAGKPAKSAEQLAQEVAKSSGVVGNIEDAIFLVMMEAAKGAREDMKSMLATMKAIKAAKLCKNVDCVTAMKATADYDAATLTALKERMKGKLESLDKISEEESLRLQMAMDRVSKLTTALSNLMKKIAGTSSTITQNMK